MKIFFINKLNPYKAQKATERYYLYRFFKKNHKVKAIIGSRKKSSKNEIVISKLCRFLPFFEFFCLLQIIVNKVWQYDICYIYPPLFFTPLIIKLLFKTKVVFDYRSSPTNQAKEFIREKDINWFRKYTRLIGLRVQDIGHKLTLRYVDHVFVISKGVKKILTNQYNISSKKFSLLPNGVDFDIFSPPKRNVSTDKNPMVYIGTIASARQREFKTVIKAIKILKKENIDIKLTIVGESLKYQKNKLKKYSKNNNVSQNLKFINSVSHYKIPQVIAKYPIAICPLPDIKSYQVSFPAKLAEYLALKKIVIGSDIKANSQIINHGYNGLLYHPGDEKDLANKIKKITNNKKLRKKLINNSRKSIKKYSWGNIFKRTENRISKLIS